MTRHEFSSIMCIGIWFEMIPREMVIPRSVPRCLSQPLNSSSRSPRSLMNAATPSCSPRRRKALSGTLQAAPADRIRRQVLQGHRQNEVAYAGILVAEGFSTYSSEGCMRDERVLPLIRTVNGSTSSKSRDT